MTVIGLDDTDSRTRGMCTTYLATQLSKAIKQAGGSITRQLLIRLNPAIEFKTRGNAAVAIHTEFNATTAFEITQDLIEEYAEMSDVNTSPGVVVSPESPDAIPEVISQFSFKAIRERISIERASELASTAGYAQQGWDGGRGRIGALAAIGAWTGLDSWTFEQIAYREFDRCGTPRSIDTNSVFTAAEQGYPQTWDTVDREATETVCVPAAPGPILFGIRGDSIAATTTVADAIESEPVVQRTVFYTNQGTDQHLRDGKIGALEENKAYRVGGEVHTAPSTGPGGHVTFKIIDHRRNTAPFTCIAFEPTKRFRDHVRLLRVGDRLTVCGEVSAGSIKLEKFALEERVESAITTPNCPECSRTMKSAGRQQGYRCRRCNTREPGKVTVPIERDIEPGWYEVPPQARRHIAKPLVRGGFNGEIHPSR